MGFKLNSLILFVTSSITGGGAWLGYELSKPKTVEGWVQWKGFKLASINNDNIWKALYFQGQSDLGEKVKDIEQLKNSCIAAWSKKENYSSSDLDYVQKFCTDNLKSRKARIIAEIGDDKFLKEDDDFKVAFIFNRYSPTFLKLLNQEKTETVPEIEGNPDILEKYKQYCKDQLDVNDSKTTLLKQICTKNNNYETATSKLNSEGLILKNLEDFKKDWENYKLVAEGEKYSVNTLFEDISQNRETWPTLQSNIDDFGTKLKAWCVSQKDRKIYEKNFYKDYYPKFKSRCSKPKEDNNLLQ